MAGLGKSFLQRLFESVCESIQEDLLAQWQPMISFGPLGPYHVPKLFVTSPTLMNSIDDLILGRTMIFWCA